MYRNASDRVENNVKMSSKRLYDNEDFDAVIVVVVKAFFFFVFKDLLCCVLE